jgi:hypothetical protein
MNTPLQGTYKLLLYRFHYMASCLSGENFFVVTEYSASSSKRLISRVVGRRAIARPR